MTSIEKSVLEKMYVKDGKSMQDIAKIMD